MSRYEMKIDTSDEAFMQDCLKKYKSQSKVEFLGLVWVVNGVTAEYHEGSYTIHLIVTSKE